MKARSRGYTVVELMMALAVFATGVTGISAMQRAVVSSNQFAKNLTLADGIAQTWLSQLSADGTMWSAGGVANTVWLSTIAGKDQQWQLPAYSAVRDLGAQFNLVGAPVQANGVFCAHIRLTWLFGDGVTNGGDSGNGLIRAEVRVFWPREGAQRLVGDCVDPALGTITAVGNAIGAYHFVTHATGVRQPKL